MQKRKKARKFHRTTGQRQAFLKGMTRSLILKGRIDVTEARAKELSSFAEKQITKAKKAGLADRRGLRKVFSEQVTKKLIDEIGPLYKNRLGGYTRITKLGPRKSDGARMAIIELVK